MKITKFSRHFTAIILAFLLLGILSIRGATASPIVSSHYVFDTFSNFVKQPDPGSYWWVSNQGDIYGDGQQNIVYDFNGDHTKVELDSQFFRNFVRLSQLPGQTAGLYYAAEVAEFQTGFSSDLPGKWEPTFLNPVRITTAVRFKGGYNPNGNGGAIGSAGLWLWNSPIDFVNGQFLPQTAFGFNYVTDSADFGQGYNFSVYKDSVPMYNQQINVDMSQWNRMDIVWRESYAGVQSLEFRVNNHLVGTHTLAEPLPALSVEIWNDNQKPTFEGILFDQVSQRQDFELDYVFIR